jgi:hypothetical protein
MKARRKETTVEDRKPRSITLLELLEVIQQVAETDDEAAATFASMLRSGRIQRLTEEALAA